MNRKLVVLWGVLAALVLGAGALVVAGGWGDDDEPLRALPLSLGAARDGDDAGAMASPEASGDAYWRGVTYVAGDDLPAMGGSGPVYRVRSAVSEADVRALADALGLSGDVEREDASYVVRDGDRALQVTSGSPAWWSYSSQAGPDGVVKAEPGVAVEEDFSGEEDAATREDAAASSGGGSTGSGSSSGSAGVDCPSDDPAVSCVPVDEVPPDDVAPPERPSDLPSKDQAREIALDMLDEAGFSIDDAAVHVEDGFTVWYVSVDPAIDGTPTYGMGSYVSVGSNGDIADAGGAFGTPEKLDDYPLISSAEAVDRLNDESFGYGYGAARDTGVASDDVGVDDVGDEDQAPAGLSTGGGDDPVSSDGSTGSDAGGDPGTCDPDGCSTEPSPGTGDPEPLPDAPDQPCKVQADGSEICEYEDPVPEPAPEPCDVDPGTGDDGVCAEPEPVPQPEPEPVEVVLHDAELVLVAMGTWDGEDAYVVPAYLMSGDGNEVTVIAIDAEFLQPPEGTEVPTVDVEDTPLPGDGATSTGDVSDPQELESGEPRIGVPYYATMILHCGMVVVGDTTWLVSDGTDVVSWQPDASTEGGTFTRADEETAEFVGDAGARTKVAKLELASRTAQLCD